MTEKIQVSTKLVPTERPQGDPLPDVSPGFGGPLVILMISGLRKGKYVTTRWQQHRQAVSGQQWTGFPAGDVPPIVRVF